jgi:hypothetical protein
MPTTGAGGAETTAAVDHRALSHGNGKETKENKVQMPATGACNSRLLQPLFVVLYHMGIGTLGKK